MAQAQKIFYDSNDLKMGLIFEMKMLWEYRYLIKTLVGENLKTRYRYSILGAFWTLLEPLATTLIMALVFTYIIPRLENFPAYLISGLAIWFFFSESTSQSFSSMIVGNIFSQKIYVPKSVFIFSTVLSRFIDLSIAAVISILISIFSGIHLYWSQVLVIVPMAMVLALIFSMGLSFLISSINIFFNDLEQIYKLSIKMLLYFSAIFYFPDFLPKPLSAVVLINPVYQIIYVFRSAVYYAEWPDLISLLYVIAVSIILFVAGLVVYSRLEKYFIYYS